MKRPEFTKQIIIEAAHVTANDICNIRNCEKGKYAQAIIKTFWSHMDGYELAKVVEGEGLRVTRDMIDDLDMMQHNVQDIYKRICWQWVKENDIQPPYPVGTKVKDTRFGDIGTIDSVSEHHPAAYCVKPDDDEINDDEINGHMRYVINFEDVEPVAAS